MSRGRLAHPRLRSVPGFWFLLLVSCLGLALVPGAVVAFRASSPSEGWFYRSQICLWHGRSVLCFVLGSLMVNLRGCRSWGGGPVSRYLER